MKQQSAILEKSGISLKQSLRWIIGMRIVFLCTALASTAISSIFFVASEAERVSFLYTPLSALLGVSAVALILTLGKCTSKLFAASQVLLDASIITGIIYITGGPISPFLFLYIPFVLATMLVFGGPMTIYAVCCCIGEYLTLLAALLNEWIIPADGSAQATVPSSGVALQVIGLVSALVLVSIFTGYLAKLFRTSRQAALRSQEALDTLKQRQHLLIDSLNEGIITTDLDLKIIGANASAEHLLGLKEREMSERSLQTILEDLDQSIGQEVLVNPAQSRFTLTLSQGKRTLHLLCERHPLANETVDSLGYLFVMQDVTTLRSVEEQLAAHERMARLLAEQQNPSSAARITFLPEFIGESPIMQKVFGLIERVAHSDATVLIGGESGTGKELAARAIHQLSNRSAKPFIAVNCGAIPENLIESELFGHRKGAFTGAISDHHGLFRQADGGTLFLDEIGELPLAMQAKLLRVLQEKVLRPVGGERDLPVNVRIIGATNRNLKNEVTELRFREDLFYRLNVINIKLPPLRDRREDIPLLAHKFLSRISPEIDQHAISPAAMQVLLTYHYPGNVRELENILERALVLGGAVILPEHLPEQLQKNLIPTPIATSHGSETQILVDNTISLPVDLDAVLSRLERMYLENALQQTKGAKKKAADLLGVNMRSFRYRCQKYQIGEDLGD